MAYGRFSLDDFHRNLERLRRPTVSHSSAVGSFPTKHKIYVTPEEIRSFVEHDMESKIRSSMTPEDARRAALIELGGAERG